MADTTQPKELNINDLLSSEKYIIPLYQRNYAWGENEITQLLQDIWDKCEENKDGNYYIGTLIVDKRNDGNLEIIDGQQRHTTLTLINAVLKKTDQNKISNLYFDARVDVQKYLTNLYFNFENTKNVNSDNEELINIKNAIIHIERFFHNKDISKFETYFYANVKIIRVFVPEGTDINHYFEVMNNRGEQLEKHEILKAKFISNIDEVLREKFGLIWDACSQMDRQIQSCFSPANKVEIFGSNYSDIPNKAITEMGVKDIVTENILFENTVLGIIEDKSLNKNTQNENQETESKYKSIIDFPNFLLQVLKLQNDNVSLDDKKLLDEFGYTNKISGRTLPDAISFINSLLYYRTLFDKYIIKREQGNDDWAWDLSKPSSDSNKNLYYINTFGKEESDSSLDNKQIIMLQSMLHVSFPANNYKNWLLDTLNWFPSEAENSEIKLEDFSIKLKKTAKEAFQNLNAKYDQGIHTPRFLFNYLDYILWLNYDKSKLSNEDKKRFEKFKFTQNNSVEHLHPQNDVENLTIIENEDGGNFKDKDKILNSFGNLCLISQSSNSKYNDYNFEAKKQQFHKKTNPESLKQVIMFSYTEWNTNKIQAHQTEMIALLEDHYK